MRVIADVDEADIGSVKVGQPVTFTVDAFPDDEFSGTVTMIRLEAQVTSNVVTYEVVIDAPNPDLKLLPGLTATVSITTNERRQVPVISNKALQVKPTEAMLALLPASATSSNHTATTTTIWVKNRDGSISQRSIVTGVSDGVNTEVLSGLQLGDEVITELSLLSNNHSSDTGQMASSPFMPARPNQKNTKK